MRIPLLILLLSILVSCKKSAVKDEYYVKYAVESTTIYQGVQLTTTIKDDKSNPLVLNINTGSWETTIGPVQKGFASSLQTVKKGWAGEVENHLKIQLSISVSKNGGPFTLKKLDSPGTTRATAETSYTVE
jgi:hypothetical protein